MSPDIILAVVILLPIILLTVLKVNATLVFLSACLGVVLMHYVGKEAKAFTDLFMPALSIGNNLQIVLYALPVVLTIIFMIRSLPRIGKLLFNILPATGFSLLTTMVLLPLLPQEMTMNVISSTAWRELEQLQTGIVSASACICLIALWLQRTGSLKDSSGHTQKSSRHHT